ncbi:MAG TPA: ABC transporter ATP-binding protein [Paracoccaceae bacterium]|nr:ABC transporter ATP-binding protein [Paracoccaceae bacterium]HMO71765.1 ABC transporter ATP-binding protein [Paracoccaceae bacterium]
MPGDGFIEIDGVSKFFGTFPAVRDVSLTMARGECFALLGASGCGKTTLLRMLAGFEEPTAGRIRIDGQDMTGVPPWERPVHMMFQSYALFPHMSVAKNVGYGLKHESMGRAERAARVAEMLDLVQMTGFEDRKPHQLSGGQRQRVALARALARQPKVLLLDEPLAALDKKLREATQFELMAIQARTKVNFVIVTHDQEEAMTLSDRLAVMHQGTVLQVGRAGDVYENPGSRYVAGFLGTVSQFAGRVGAVTDGMVALEVPDFAATVQVTSPLAPLLPGETLTLALRPEKVRLTRERPAGGNAVPGTVRDLAYFGKDSLYRITLPSGALISVHAVNASRGAQAPDWDDEVWVGFDAGAGILLRD